MNKIELTGRLVADAELKYTGSGFPIVKFRLAVDRYKPKEGYQVVDFIPVKYVGKGNDEKAGQLTKGKLVKVVGELHIDKPTGEGKQYWTEVVSFDVSFDIGEKKEADKPKPDPKPESKPQGNSGINLDDLPF